MNKNRFLNGFGFHVDNNNAMVNFLPRLNSSTPVKVSRQQMRDALVWGSCALAAIVVALGAWLLQIRIDNTLIAKNFGQTDSGFDIQAPLAAASALPKSTDILRTMPNGQTPIQETGTTIMVRQPAPVEEPGRPLASIAPQPGITTSAVGIYLGNGLSFSTLAKRYAMLARAAPVLFSSLQPRATIIDTQQGMEAHLIAGPIKSVAIAERLCAKIRLRIETTCTPANFTGKVLQFIP